MKNDRQVCLETANEYVNKDRNSQYDEPERSFQNIGDLWNVYLSGVLGQEVKLTEGDVAALMVLLKAARLMAGHESGDNWIDIAGYAACGYEVTR